MILAWARVGTVTAAILATASASGWKAQEAAPRQGIVDLTIGGESEVREKYSFTAVSGIAVDGEGRIFVSDARENTVRVYSPAGIHLFDVGRQGQGPGELQDPAGIAFDRAGHLWVRDGGNLRYVGFTVTRDGARPFATVRMAHSAGRLWAPLTFDPAGNIIDIGDASGPDGRHVRVRFHVDARGNIASADTVPQPRADSAPEFTSTGVVKAGGGDARVTSYFYQPFGGMWIQAHSPTGEWANGASSGYAVAWMDAKGKLLRRITRSIPPPPPLSAANRKTAEDRFDSFMKRTGVSRSAIPFGIPERKAPLREIAFDGDGRLWVERSVISDTPRLADIFGRDGRRVATVTWPSDITILGRGDAREWTAYGVGTDSLGVQRVVRIRFK